ncbi:uncharacterized protein N7477_009313 [Penicillium maclennaniae]|uniref:uncharacterized protein n=1 Tax=Penicillium maclennaniae TaxID=1343394 RepID=UPI002542473F|nr:uncharacterized protein N7477_009313 [Penicillium maclennaniae]KAJ5661697.1 hypothetical protein N7477_009313 [Penicillium maclennaniae]
MSTPNDLQTLLASIRGRPSPPNGPGQDYYQQRPQQQYQQPYQPGMFPPHHPQQPYDGQGYPHPQPHGYFHPSVSSNMQSPAPVNTPPHHGSDILSPNVPTPRNDWPQQPPQQQQQQQPPQPVDLLSLLRFSQGQGAAPSQAPVMAPEQSRSPPTQETTSPHGRNTSASDFVASLFGKQAAPPAPAPSAPAEAPPAQPEGPSENTQDMLLRLLNRYQPDAPALVPTTQTAAPESAKNEPKEIIEIVEASPKAPAEPEPVVSPGSKDSMFTYVNPFDQLAAMSPRKQSPHPQSDDEGPEIEVTKKVNVTANIERVTAPAMPRLKRSDQQDAVNEVVGRLVDQIGRSLSGSQAKALELEREAPTVKEEPTNTVIADIADQLRETVAEAKEEAGLEMPAESVKQVKIDISSSPVGQSGNENTDALADSWESAEDSAEKEEERVVSVHNFPLRPFISIAVKPQSGKLMTFRDDDVMDIARLKKEFDQLDRSLTAATSEYIVYALAKTGGIRIIRQDDGSDRQVLRSTRDRVFNVALCTSASTTGQSEVQAFLGIGVSGTVYWALISGQDKDLFEQDALERDSLIFPPFPASDENTSGGQLKTRAKRSTRHADLFAIGRGKNIYVVSPYAAMHPNYGVSGAQRTVNTEKFLKERALKISTGKAGKDFAFSDDDTVIASLDKTGRLRFWDIKDVLENPSFADGPVANEVRVPLNTFVTGSPAEKSWPTSVLFLDKLRAYSKSTALRYVLVGLKQNHTLQLWDIGLGKAVEEVKFPHENESDAICSVAYHPASGIVVVGHPTRNSIYFVHLSAPRYNLPVMSQAEFIKASTEKDSNLPKPESTACLSGIREISLGSKGQLRSLELLPTIKSATDKRGAEETGLFELYVMHSHGVTCLNIKKEDLGWTSDNKVIRPIDGLEEGTIEISDLQTFPSYVTDDPSVNGDTASTTPSRAATVKDTVKKTDVLESTAGIIPSRNASPTKVAKKKPVEEHTESATPSGAEKPEKKKKKKASASEATLKAKEPTVLAGIESFPTKEIDSLATSTAAMAATRAAEGTGSNGLVVSSLPASAISSEDLNQHMVTLQGTVSAELNKSLGQEFESLYRRFDDERRSWDAASSAKQDQVLRLVSSTLSDNVEKNLTRIVSQSIQTEVIPAIGQTAAIAVAKQVNSIVTQQLGSLFKDELRQALPKAVANALQQPAVLKTISDSVAENLAPRLETEVSKAVQGSIAPLIETLSLSTKKIETDMERQFQAQIRYYEAQRQSDNAKLEEMATMLRGLSTTVASLAANQTRQSEPTHNNRPSVGRPTPEEIVNVAPRAMPQPQPQPHPHPLSRPQSRPSSGPPQNVAAQSSAPAPLADTAEATEISRLLNAGRYEDATMKWIQSSQQADLFDHVFVNVRPDYLPRLSAMLMLSVGVATNVAQRLNWINVILNNMNLADPEMRDVTPKIMQRLSERLNGLYMDVVNRNPQDPLLRLIIPLTRRAHGMNV